MESASHWQQLSAESGRKFEAPAAPPVAWDRAHILKFERYVHGECRVSIYPQPQPQRPAAVRTCAAAELKAWMGLSAKRAEQMRQQALGRQPLLVQNAEFQDRDKEISGWGALPKKKIFRRRARRSIAEWGEIAWRKFGQSGVFLTGTVPGSGAVIAETVARYSGWLMNRVKQWFRDGFSTEYAVSAVWELQKRGMLHIHLCVLSTQKRVLERLLKEWKERWNGLLLELSKNTGVDLFRKNKWWSWQENLEATRQDAQWLIKNPARYLAKYLQKGSRDSASKSAFHPSRWWSVDRKTMAEARAERVRVLMGGYNLQELQDAAGRWFESASDYFEKVYPFDNPHWEGCGGVVAFADSEQSLNLATWFEVYLKANFEVTELVELA